MCGSGARTGMEKRITGIARSRPQPDLIVVCTVCCEAVAGTTGLIARGFPAVMEQALQTLVIIMLVSAWFAMSKT